MIKKDITTIEKGVIMHQVNCQDVMGAGVAKALYTRHPKVKAAFHQMAEKTNYNTPDKRLGLVQPVTITPELIILNSYSQLYFGRNKNVKYTDESKLIANLRKLDNYAKKRICQLMCLKKLVAVLLMVTGIKSKILLKKKQILSLCLGIREENFNEQV